MRMGHSPTEFAIALIERRLRKSGIIRAMSTASRSPTYQRCQALFDRRYPQFRDAGMQYHDLVAALLPPGGALLDLGCGRDSLAAGPITQAGHAVGIDLSRADLRANSVVHHALLADGGALPLATASFDLVISQWVVEHLARPRPVFAEISRVLRPGGHVLVFTTNAWNYVPLASRLLPDSLQQLLIARLLKRPTHESFPTFYRANTPAALTRLARSAGLAPVELRFVGNPFYLAFAVPLFRLALGFEQLTDWSALRRFKLYLLAVFRK